MEIQLLAMFLTALGTFFECGRRSKDADAILDALILENEDVRDQFDFSWRKIVAVPVFATASLLLFYYFFSIVSFFVSIASVFTSFAAIQFAIMPAIERAWPARLIAGLIVVGWLVDWPYGWLCHNAIGIATCIAAASFLRVGRFPQLCLLFALLLAYDVFFVFFSERFFAHNVMVHVATQQATNPVHTVAKAIGAPPVPAFLLPRIELPVKLLFPPSHMLGLGDVALPALVAAFGARFDRIASRRASSLFRAAVLGYAIGLLLTVAVSVYTRAPQPALLYLAPTTLAALVVAAPLPRRTLWHTDVLKKISEEGRDDIV